MLWNQSELGAAVAEAFQPGVLDQHGEAQRVSWRMLAAVNRSLDLSSADVIAVAGVQAGAHIALLARQFPALAFVMAGDVPVSGGAVSEGAVRVLWSPDGDAGHEHCGYDAIVTAHCATAARAVLDRHIGYARVAAVRDIGEGRALSVFGKGLARDLFRPVVRCCKAA